MREFETTFVLFLGIIFAIFLIQALESLIRASKS